MYGKVSVNRRLEFHFEEEVAFSPILGEGMLAHGEYTFRAQIWDEFGYFGAQWVRIRRSNCFSTGFAIVSVLLAGVA
ncbi:MAG: hypothetical protein SGJ19_02695 [Planctomycetia bacterium]|nr:hypothetical protein [Planctomycetia bacterium]